ncbi:MAG TPA: AAA family ATPase [Candidatus Binatia bacterium]|nr:AAA family ATPase [Candidatus Binatia bacterium]
MRQPRLADPVPLRIEPENEWAWCGDRKLDLTPKAFAVLRYLIARPRRLVTKAELLEAIWNETIVSESALTSCIRDLRKALGDSSRSPRYLETVHRRGFRFIGPVTASEAAFAGAVSAAAAAPAAPGGAPAAVAAILPNAPLVGRDGDLARLRALFASALGGRRQVVFVTGEAGIGKTSLVEAFLAGVTERGAGGDVRIGRGQCVEQYGAGEAYLPVLEALGRMGREPGGDALVATLRQHAPTWLVQLPALLTDEDFEAVQRRAHGSTRERMMRELIEALDVLAGERALVLVLEDLHWSDSGTVDLLAMLARRRDPARLLLVGTARAAEIAASSHPLKPVKQELQIHGQCDEIVLDFLTETAVGEYLARRFPEAPFVGELTRVLHRSTGGNPLFLVNLVDHLLAQGRLREEADGWRLAIGVDEVASDLPETLWQIVEKQIERLSPEEHAVLAVGGVAGLEFSAALATADGIAVADADQRCATLARRGQLVRALGVAEWPDGTVAGRYGFIHALYRKVLYARVEVGHRVGLHARIGTRLEQAYGAGADEIAGELAMHFEEGRDVERAIAYHGHAADNALRRYGHREAASHATRALELIATLPESPGRLERELAMRTALAAAQIRRGADAPEVVRTYADAKDVSTRMDAKLENVPALIGLFRYYISRADLRAAGEIAERLAPLADAADDTAIVVAIHNAVGVLAFYAGDFENALARLERGLAAYAARRQRSGRVPAVWGGHDAVSSCGVHTAWVLGVLGYPARASAMLQEALDRARATASPFMLATSCSYAAVIEAAAGADVALVRELSEEASRHVEECRRRIPPGESWHAFELLLGVAGVHVGWVRAESGEREAGADAIHAAIAGYRARGALVAVPTFLALLADEYRKDAQAEKGLAVVDDGLAMSDSTGSRYWDAELWRLRGALLVGAKGGARRAGRPAAKSPEADAESCFRKAIDIARRQGAKGFELRAASDLARLWRASGKVADARALLAETEPAASRPAKGAARRPSR